MGKTFRNRKRGSAIAELPVNLWVFVFLMLIPCIDLITVGYRAALAYWGLRDATTKAAFAQTFSTAYTQATSAINNNAGVWTGISYTPLNLYVVQVDPSGPSQSIGPVNAPWTGTINSGDVYLIRGTVSASISPLMNMASTGTWGSVPGITSPLTLTFTYQVADENPQGLIN